MRIISLVVKYLPSKQISWVRFPDDAFFIRILFCKTSINFARTCFSRCEFVFPISDEEKLRFKISCHQQGLILLESHRQTPSLSHWTPIMKLQLPLAVLLCSASSTSAFQNHFPSHRGHRASSFQRGSTAQETETVTKEDLLGARDAIDKLLREKACGESKSFAMLDILVAKRNTHEICSISFLGVY